MSETEDLQLIARERFGREIDADQARRFSPRLPRMAVNAGILDDWARRLDRLEPAMVHRMPDVEEIYR